MTDKYVSQTEFERFEHQNARAFEEIRSAIGELARDFRQMSRQPTNWGWVLSAVGTFTLIGTAIGGLVAYGLNQRMDYNAERTDSAVRSLSDMIVSGSSDTERELNRLRGQFDAHTRNGHPDTTIDQVEQLRKEQARLRDKLQSILEGQRP